MRDAFQSSSSRITHSQRFLIHPPGSKNFKPTVGADDDAAEASHHEQPREASSSGKRKEKSSGQNTSRNFGSSKDRIALCQSRATLPEFSPSPCRFGERCTFEHDLRRYLKDGKRDDLSTFNGMCPVWDARGMCNAGWKCRFVGSHSREKVHDDGRRELVLVEDGARKSRTNYAVDGNEGTGVVNVVSTQAKIDLTKRKMKTERADT